MRDAHSSRQQAWPSAGVTVLHPIMMAYSEEAVPVNVCHTTKAFQSGETEHHRVKIKRLHPNQLEDVD